MLLKGLARLALLALLLTASYRPVLAVDHYVQARREMVTAIADMARETSIYIDNVALDPRVMTAMGKVPRHAFVPFDERALAYKNRPLPIGHGQTISQPYIVALMTDLLKLKPGDRVFELGTGSGYQAAILAQMATEVYTMEIIAPLADKARAMLHSLHYDNVQVRSGDGYYGWAAHAPFDAIVVTAAASHIPPPLIQQMKPGGRMVIPVGSRFLVQQLVLVEKQADGSLTTRQILPVMFVPLRGGH